MSQETLTNADSANPQMARAQIEQTRARMSETIDEIEDLLLRKKEQIQNRLDVGAPIRERPLPSLGIALGAGIVIGFLTGGDDHDDKHHRELEERAETWELRARQLMRIAQQQEAMLHRLGAVEADGEISWEPDAQLMGEETDGQGSSRLSEMGDLISHRVSEFLGDAVRQMFSPRA